MENKTSVLPNENENLTKQYNKHIHTCFVVNLKGSLQIKKVLADEIFFLIL